MRSLIFGIPILLAVAVLQSTVLYHIRFLNGSFDTMLIVVLAWSLAQRGNDGLIWALVGGIIADSLSAGPPGAMTVSLVSVIVIISITEGRFYKANWLVAMISSVLGTLVYHLIYLVALIISGYPIGFIDSLAVVTFPSAILNFLLMLPMYQTARLVARLTAPPKVEMG
jgi:rod shape-determining protein MreD